MTAGELGPILILVLVLTSLVGASAVLRLRRGSATYVRVAAPTRSTVEKVVEGNPNLLGVNAKLNRGREHLVSLIDLVQGWGASEPYTILKECNDDRTEFHIGIEFRDFPDVLHWGLLAGEVLFNFRCALDHIVYALAVAGSGSAPPPKEGQLAFPITTTPEEFDKAIERRLRSVPAEAVEIIRVAQPFRDADPTRHALFRLHRLNNVDKHRLIHVAVFALRSVETKISGFERGPVEVTVNESPLERISPLVRFKVPRPIPGIDVELAASIRISFPDEPPPRKSMLENLEEVCQATLKVTNDLRPFA